MHGVGLAKMLSRHALDEASVREPGLTGPPARREHKVESPSGWGGAEKWRLGLAFRRGEADGTEV